MKRIKRMVFVVVAVAITVIITILFYWYELNLAICMHYNVTVDGKPDLTGRVFSLGNDVLYVVLVSKESSTVECYLLNPKTRALTFGEKNGYIRFGPLAIIGSQHNLEKGSVVPATLDADIKVLDSKITIYLKGAGEGLKMNDADSEIFIRNHVAYHRNMILDKRYDK